MDLQNYQRDIKNNIIKYMSFEKKQRLYLLNNKQFYNIDLDKNIVLESYIFYGKCYNNITECIRKASLKREINLLKKYFLPKYYYLLNIRVKKNDTLNIGMEAAAEVGDFNLVNYFISKGANNWDFGIKGAIKNRNMKMIKFFIDKGFNNSYIALKSSAKIGDMKLLEFFTNKFNVELDEDIIHIIIQGAAEGGHLDLVKLYLNKTDKENVADIFYAIDTDNKEIIEYLIEIGLEIHNSTIGSSIGNFELFEFLVSNFEENIEWECILNDAIRFGDMKYIQLCILKIQNIDNYSEQLQEAANSGNYELVQFFLQKNARIQSRKYINKDNLEIYNYFN